MNSPQDQALQNQLGAQQQAGLSNLGQAAQAPRPPTNLEEAIQKLHRLIEAHNEMIGRAGQFIDRINGSRPEKEHPGGAEVGGASGQLSELHRLLDIVEAQSRELNGKLETIDGTV